MATYSLLPNDICEVIFHQTYDGSKILSVLHYQFRGPELVEDGRAEVNALITSLSTVSSPNQIISSMLDCQVANLAHQFVTGQVVQATRRPYETVLADHAGAYAGDGLPSNVAAVITKQSALPGRGRSGSLHVAGLGVNTYVDSTFTGAFIALLDTLAGRLTLTVPMTAGVGYNWHPVIWSPRHPTGANDIFGVLPQDTVRVMRRRTLRVGE